MNGKGRLAALLICAGAALPLCAQTNVAASREELVLTGVTEFSSYRRAFFRVEMPGQPPLHRTLAEGEQFGDVTLLTIDSEKAKVTLRYRGSLRELTFNARTGASSAPTAKEQQRDASHATHHSQRAQLERERDERENSE